MARLTDKINAHPIAPLPQRYTFEYLEAVWALMIAYGSAQPAPAEYAFQPFADPYGGNVHFHTDLTREAVDKIAAVGINWSRTTDPAEDEGSEFIDTETPHRRFNYLYGNLALNDGTRYWWAAKVDADFGELIQALTIGVTLDDALDEVRERLDRKFEDNRSVIRFRSL